MSVDRWLTPEEEELARKREELASLESELADGETTLATLLVEMRQFEGRYLRVIGQRYAQLDELEALARLSPGDRAARQEAQRAREQATETSENLDGAGSDPLSKAPSPSKAIRKLYREAAKAVHPDLGTDSDRAQREAAMAEVNRAFGEGDDARLRVILRDWRARPEAVTGGGIPEELVRTIRKIAQVRTRIETIVGEIRAIEASELYRLREEVDRAAAEGRDALEELGKRLDEQIASARLRLDVLTKQGSPR